MITAIMCNSGAMGFFDRALRPPARPTEPRRRQRPMPAWVKPETEVPAVVEVARVMARSDRLAIALTELRAYSTGFSFGLCSVLRVAVSGLSHSPWGPPGPLPDDEDVPDDVLRVGVGFADGASVTNLDRRFGGYDLDNEPRRPFLMYGSAGSSGRRYTADHWVWPLPPPGPMTFVVEWPAFGIAESRVEVDAGLVLGAAARCLDLWPGEPSMVDDWSPVASISESSGATAD